MLPQRHSLPCVFHVFAVCFVVVVVATHPFFMKLCGRSYGTLITAFWRQTAILK